MLNVKFENSKDLLKVLSSIDNIIKKNKAENCLKYILFEKVKDKLCISARNPYMRIGYFVNDTIKIDGDSTLFDCKTIISMFNVLDGVIEINDNVIQNNKCKYKVNSLSVEEYPDDVFPDIENKNEINTEDFKKAIDSVLCATQKSEYENALNGVYLNTNKLVGCDGNRIFIKEINNELENIIIPKDLVNEISRLPFQEKIFMMVFGQNIIFEDENLYISCNYINKDYPKYEQLLPRDTENEFYFSKQDFNNALNLIKPIVNQATNKCNLKISNNEMTISTNNNTQSAETKIKIEQKNELNETLEIAFNINFLVDMVNVNDEKITLIKHNSGDGYTFKSGNAIQYIMPILH